MKVTRTSHITARVEWDELVLAVAPRVPIVADGDVLGYVTQVTHSTDKGTEATIRLTKRGRERIPEAGP